MEDNEYTIIMNSDEVAEAFKNASAEERGPDEASADTDPPPKDEGERDTCDEDSAGCTGENPDADSAGGDDDAGEDPDIALEAELAALIGAELPDSDTITMEQTAASGVITDENESAEPSDAERDISAEEGTESPEKEGESLGLPEDHPEMGEIRGRIEERRRYKEKKKRRSRSRLCFICAVTALTAVFVILSLTGFFTVDSIEVKGNYRYTAEEIINMGHAAPGRNLLFDPRKSETEDYLVQNPYIKSAKVSRKLPSTLVISIKEREEKLALGYDDDYLVLDGSGILLRKARTRPKVTLVKGLVVNRIKPGEKIGTEDPALTNKVLKLIRAMGKADLYFARIELPKKNKVIRAYVYDNLAVRAEYDVLMENISNGRLHMVIEKLMDEGIKRGTVTFDGTGTASFMPAI